MGVQRQTGLLARQEQRWQRYRDSPNNEPSDRAYPATMQSTAKSNLHYQFDEFVVHRSDGQRILIVHDRSSGHELALRFTPLEYAVLVPLIERFGQPVAAETLYRAAFAMSRAPRDDRRLYRHIDRIRPKLSPLGMVIRSVAHHGYVLMKAPDEDR
ncbi:MAG TPA: helix-turn-helix domain-containing protein [Ktedonobacterales bacterium]|nr:helix-turn-helix domain-containing protein [Ktedonobacterales bacterium]